VKTKSNHDVIRAFSLIAETAALKLVFTRYLLPDDVDSDWRLFRHDSARAGYGDDVLSEWK
jgi:hypothetical protein